MIREISDDTKASLRKKENLLRKGQESWKMLLLENRIACLRRYADLLNQNKEELAQTLSLEVGKPIHEARNEIAGAIYRTEFFLNQSHKYLEPQIVNEVSGTLEVLGFEPLGVVTHISAWNYPYLIATNILVPALIAGNAVLYKPSEYATLSGLHMQRLLQEAGVPEEVLQTAIGGGEIGKALLKLPLDGYFFTGSYKTGRAISKSLAGRLIPVVLEMGGKDPLYVMDDVQNISQVAAGAVEGSFYNAGQSCCAVERIYVHENIYDRFVAAFVEEVRKLKIGPITRPQHVSVLTQQIQDALSKGAKLAVGGQAVEGKGSFFEPTILLEVNHSMNVMKEETFGPVIGIQKVSGDEEAVALMNDTEYGLTASVYSQSEERSKKVLQKLDVGTGYWNCCDRVSPYLPWSGRRHSGQGVTLSYLGIQVFVKPKAFHLRNPTS